MIILFINYHNNFEIFIFPIHQSNSTQTIIINDNIILKYFKNNKQLKLYIIN
jgi:hypothetical protein